MSHASPKRDDLIVRELDLPGLPFCELSPREPPPREIIEHGLGCNPKRRRSALDRIGAVRPAERVGAHPVDLDRRKAPMLAEEPDVLAPERAATGRDEALPVQCRCDLLVHSAGAVERAHAPSQPLKVDVIAIGVDPHHPSKILAPWK